MGRARQGNPQGQNGSAARAHLEQQPQLDRENPWRTLYLMNYALIAFRLKADPVKIKEKYYGGK